MIESYALLALPLAAFFSYFDKRKGYLKSISLFVIFITVNLNLFQTQQTKTCLHYDAMSEEAYWSNFATLGWPYMYEEMLQRPDYEAALEGIDEYRLNKKEN